MRQSVEQIGLKLLRRLEPEAAHGLAIKAVNMGLAPLPGPVTSPRLATRLAGIDLFNPVGLAAGFDKNAQAVTRLSRAGFGFIEVGAATPHPQPGNPKPRLFRLTEDQAAINRFGFNNDGMEAIAARLAAASCDVPVGINLGANKTSADRADDFAKVMEMMRDHVQFATVNVSSPNTEKLRDLQGAEALAALLEGVMRVRGSTPVFLKIAPDLTAQELADVAQVAQAAKIDAIIATNTTLARDGLQNAQKDQAGGLSGQPLFEKSTRVLALLSTLTDIPLVGVGGIASGAQAYAKIRAGASAVQLYTGLVYGGLSLAARIPKDLDALLLRDGFASVAEACGTDRDRWL
ncbi:MAG: quinone-dependent dihydroorotate dehydrogenase [Roseobacter sp.]|jgi:dihydroorotate dehydrogenase|nr:quinone-dependent dihydroorotate dehydrogenase [Roseobacter sp.]